MDNQVAMLLLKQLQEIHLLLVNHFNKTPPIAQVPTSAPYQFQDLIDEYDVIRILNVSRSTVYRLRKANVIKTFRIGKKFYYNIHNIESFRNHFLK